jgi:hypothetical protein
MPHRLTPRSPLPRFAILAVMLAALLPITTPARAQGCALCRDNTASTPPATQSAYRHAIVLLGGAGCVLFAGTVFLLKRQR